MTTRTSSNGTASGLRDSQAQSYYKETLHKAQVWKGRFEEGFKAGINHRHVEVTSLPYST